MAHIYLYIYINIVICNGNLFSLSRFISANIRYYWINFLRQISLPDNLFHHISGNFTIWHTHLVTHPKNIICFPVANNQAQAIFRFIVLYHQFGKTTTLRSSKIISRSVSIVMSNFRVFMQQKLYMHIKICTASIGQAYLSRYKQLQKIKTSKKGLLNDYSQKIIFSISRLQDKSSEVVESNIQRNSRGL